MSLSDYGPCLKLLEDGVRCTKLFGHSGDCEQSTVECKLNDRCLTHCNVTGMQCTLIKWHTQPHVFERPKVTLCDKTLEGVSSKYGIVCSKPIGHLDDCHWVVDDKKVEYSCSICQIRFDSIEDEIAHKNEFNHYDVKRPLTSNSGPTLCGRPVGYTGANVPLKCCKIINHTDGCEWRAGGIEFTLNNAVEHPVHYTSHPAGIECISVTEHFNFNIGNAIKYLWRAGLKGEQEQDLRKSLWYVNREIERITKK